MKERRLLPKRAELRVAQTDHGRTLTGYAAVWDSYSQNLGGFVEIIRRGFFADALGGGADVMVLLNHDMNQILGRRSVGDVALEEDDIGLRYSVPLIEGSHVADEVSLLVERGVLRGSSFSFLVPPEGESWSWTEQGYPLRQLERGARLFDVGPAAMPAYADTEVSGQLALRSLAESTGVPFEIVADAAHRNALGDILRGKPNETDDEPNPGEVAASRAVERARRLRLAEVMVPVR